MEPLESYQFPRLHIRLMIPPALCGLLPAVNRGAGTPMQAGWLKFSSASLCSRNRKAAPPSTKKTPPPNYPQSKDPVQAVLAHAGVFLYVLASIFML